MRNYGIIYIVNLLIIGTLNIVKFVSFIILLIKDTLPTILDMVIKHCENKIYKEECKMKKNNNKLGSYIWGKIQTN